MPGRLRPRSRGGGRGFSPEEVIDALYRGLLDRPVEPQGLDHHLGLLAEGHGLDTVVYGIGHSREYFETWMRAGDLPALVANAWRSRAERPNEPTLFLLHIMKTGGTTLLDALRSVAGNRFCVTQVFQDQLVALPPVVVQLASLVSGHLGAEALELLPAGTVSATVIRDPIERVLSHYAHVLSDPAIQVESTGLTLEEFVYAPRWRPYCENFQARSLVHRVGLAGMWRDRSPETLLAELDEHTRPRASRLPLQNLFDLGPMAVSGDALRRAALEQLDAIDIVGVTDRLEGIFYDMAAVWGVDAPPPLPRSNVSESRPQEAEIPQRLREAILEANAVDLALYESARSRAAAASTRPARAVDAVGDPAAPVASLDSLPISLSRRTDAAGTTGAGSLPAGTTDAAGRSVAPRDRTRLVASVLRAATQPRPSRWPVAVALAASAVTALVDTFLAQRVVLIGLLVFGPCCALLAGRWRATAAVGATSLGLAALSGLTDGLWGTADYSLFLATVAIVSVGATMAAAVIEHSTRPTGGGPRHRPWTDGPVADRTATAGHAAGH